MNAKTITAIIPAAKPARVRGVNKPSPVAPVTAQVIAALAADIAAEKAAEAAKPISENAAGFNALVLEHKAEILKAASRTGQYRDSLRAAIKVLAEYAAAHGMARIEAGKALAQILGMKTLMENKDIANAWQYAAGNAGLESTRKGPAGKVTSGKADKSENLDSDNDGEPAGKVAANNVTVAIADSASAQDVVSAFKTWAARHKAQAREALEMIALWREMVAVQAEFAKAATTKVA